MDRRLLLTLAVVLTPIAFGQAPADIFMDKCAVCHGADGAGKTAKGKKVKAVDVRESSKKMTADAMLQVLTNGKGTDMEGYAKVFSADQLKGLVAYYRGLAK